MATYWVINAHEEGQCEQMMSLLDHVPAELKGIEVWCTCPAGEHAYYMIAEGTDPKSLLASLPEELHIGTTRALEMESVTL